MKKQVLSVVFAFLVVTAGTALRKGFASASQSATLWNTSAVKAQPVSQATHTLSMGASIPPASTQKIASIGGSPVPVPPYRTVASIGGSPVPVPPYRTLASIGGSPVPVPPYRMLTSIGGSPVPVPPYNS